MEKPGTFQSYIPTNKFSDIVGIEEKLEEIRDLVAHMKHPEVYEHAGVKPPRGLLLHGPPGCGKTSMALAIAGELTITVVKVAATELAVKWGKNIPKLFEQAMALAPCIIFIDNVDAITIEREATVWEEEKKIVSQLVSCFDDLDRRTAVGSVFVVGTANRPDSIDLALRRAGRFDREISLGFPDVKARQNILQTICKNMKTDATVDLEFLALNTPGYVGADLQALVSEAGAKAIKRTFADIEALSSTSQKPKTKASSWDWLCQQGKFSPEQLQVIAVTQDDFKAAAKLVQPSSLREGFPTVPYVTWADVGALNNIRQELNRAILLPIRHKALFEALGLGTPSGVLLYGPPGCGKTLLAKAMTNEAGINFISVKGPELLNMWLGESERAVREVFERARNSKPCVIFFDELDGLCPRRHDNHNEHVSSIVNQMLTEMDGVQSRCGVFLMAATNRPDTVDPAVLRPGRLDKTLYVGFPTAEDRAEILLSLTKKTALAADVNLKSISADPRLDGYTGADLHALVQEAATQVVEECLSRRDVSVDILTISLQLHHFQAAIEKIKPSVSMKDREKYIAMARRFN